MSTSLPAGLPSAGFTCLGGLALLCSLVWQVELVELRRSVQALGLWLVPFLLLDSVSLWLHTVGWRAYFRPGQHGLHLWQLGLLRLAGSAVNWVTPLAGIGGEVVKILLLESTMPRAQADQQRGVVHCRRPLLCSPFLRS